MNTKRKTIKMPVRYLMNLVLVGLLFVGLSYVTGNMLSTYQNKVLLTVGINIILAVSLNVATGYLGQLPLGHAGFMAVGAYACALFTKSSGLPKGVAFAIGLVLAWVIAGLFAWYSIMLCFCCICSLARSKAACARNLSISSGFSAE